MRNRKPYRGNDNYRQGHLRLAQGKGVRPPNPYQPPPRADYMRRMLERRLLAEAYLRTEVDWSDDPLGHPDDYVPSDFPHSIVA